MAARIDVIVPCYNYGHLLPDCVGSILCQRGVAVRVLVIDDASTDGSQQAARAIAASDPRVHLIEHAINRGHIATFNEGLDWVAAEFMLLISADDVLPPGALARATAALQRYPGVGLAYGQPVYFHGNPVLPPDAGAADADITPGAGFIRAFCQHPRNPVEAASAVVRTDVQKRAGPYDPALPHSADLDMWLRFAAVADVARLPSPQALVRLHGANMRLGYESDGMLRDIDQRDAAIRSFFARDTGLPDQAELQRQAARALAREALRWSWEQFVAGRPYRPLLDLSQRIDPDITRTPSWRRHQVTRMLGRRPARAVMSAVRRVRGLKQ